MSRYVETQISISKRDLKHLKNGLENPRPISIRKSKAKTAVKVTLYLTKTQLNSPKLSIMLSPTQLKYTRRRYLKGGFLMKFLTGLLPGALNFIGVGEKEPVGSGMPLEKGREYSYPITEQQMKATSDKQMTAGFLPLLMPLVGTLISAISGKGIVKLTDNQREMIGKGFLSGIPLIGPIIDKIFGKGGGMSGQANHLTDFTASIFGKKPLRKETVGGLLQLLPGLISGLFKGKGLNGAGARKFDDSMRMMFEPMLNSLKIDIQKKNISTK